MLPLPEDESTWDTLHIVFATSLGGVRRNRLSDFGNIRANGLIAMKLEEEGERLIAVRTCSEAQDILLAARGGKCIRFHVGEVRVFTGRTSTGVRGIKLADGDEVISMSTLLHAEFDTAERDAYLRMAAQRRRACRRTQAADPAAPSASISRNRTITMPLIPWAEWLPDQPNVNTPVPRTAWYMRSLCTGNVPGLLSAAPWIRSSGSLIFSAW